MRESPQLRLRSRVRTEEYKGIVVTTQYKNNDCNLVYSTRDLRSKIKTVENKEQ